MCSQECDVAAFAITANLSTYHQVISSCYLQYLQYKVVLKFDLQPAVYFL